MLEEEGETLPSHGKVDDLMGEVIFLLLLLVGCILLFTMTGDFPISVLDKSGGAALFPNLVLVFLMIVLGIRIILILLTKEKDTFVFTEMFKGTRGIYLGSLFLYILVMPLLGYLITTFIFVAGLMNTFYYNVHEKLGSTKAIVLRNTLVVVLVVIVNFFFKEVLGVNLPTGFLGD